MFKKIVLLALVMSLGWMAFSFEVDAMPSDYQAEQLVSIDDQFVTWDITMQNGAYLLQSNKVYYELVEVDNYHFPTFINHELLDSQVFISNYNGVSSVIKVYDQATATTPISTHTLVYEAPEATEMFIVHDLYQRMVIQPGTFIQFSFVLNQSLTFSYRELVRDSMNTSYDMTFTGFIPEVPFQDVTYLTASQLPSTEGNINIDGRVGYVSYRVVDQTVSLRIVYNNQAFYHQKTLSDVGFLLKDNIAYYYTDDESGDPIVYLDYGSEATPFLFDTSETSVKWRPFLLWNLRTNEIYSTDKVTVLSHIQNEDAHNVYSYFYMPYIDYDDILQVQIDFDYRYYNDSIWSDIGLKKEVSNTFSKMMVLERGQVTATTPQFVYNAYNGGMTAMVIGATMMFIPTFQQTGFTLFLGGLATYATAKAIDEFELVTTLVENIEPFTPSTSFRTFLEEKYSSASGIQDLTIDPTDTLHRLHLGQFQIPSGYEDVEIVPGSAQFTHIIYQYQDQVIEIERPYVNDFHNYDGDHIYEPLPDDTPEDTISKKDLITLIIGGVGLIVFLGGILLMMKGRDKDGYSDSMAKYRRNI